MKIKGTLQKIILESTNETKLLLTNVRIENLIIKINFFNFPNEVIELNLNNAYAEDAIIEGEISERILEEANLGNKICLNLQERGTDIINATLNATLKSIEIESEE